MEWIDFNYKELMDFVNKCTKERKCVNKIYGIKEVDGEILYQIVHKDDPRVWVPKHNLSIYQEKLINKWMNTFRKYH